MLTPEQRTIGRRNFLKAAAALPAVGALAGLRNYTGTRVRCGIIGTGGEGQVLLETAPANMLDVVCLCDINQMNRERAKQIVENRWGRPLGEADVIADDYRKLVHRNDIEAVIIATPLWLHADMTIDALEAGKHVFCEKTMGYTIDECRKMKEVAAQTGRNLQIGHQRFYSPLYEKMYMMIAQDMLGEIYHVRSLWHRNGDWRRPVDPAWEGEFGDMLREHFGYQSVEHLINWRLYTPYSQGLAAELASHQVAITNWIAPISKPGEARERAVAQGRPSFTSKLPTAVYSTGGVYHWGADGRDIEDHMFSTWEYDNQFTVTWSSICTNRLDHYYEQIMGTKGTLYLTGETEILYFPEPGVEIPEGAPSATEVQSQAVAAGGAADTASDSRGADAAGLWGTGGSAAGGIGIMDAYTEQLRGFAHTIRNGYPNLCDPQVGFDAAVACLSSRQAMVEGRRLALNNGRPLASA